MLEANDRYQASQLAELRIMAAGTKQLVDLAERRFDLGERRFEKLELSIESLTALANKWKGVLLVALVAGPVIGSIVAMIIRVIVFGVPLSRGGGLVP